MRKAGFVIAAVLWVVLGSLMLAGCAPLPASQRIGTLRVVGPEVTVNGARGTDGMTIHSGDKVATGPASNAYVNLVRDGFVHLDENTDPTFEEILDQGQCLIVITVRFAGRLFGGEWNNPRSEECERKIVSQNMQSVVSGSSFHFSFGPEGDVFTLISGRARLLEPVSSELSPGEQVIVRPGRTPLRRRVDEAEIQRIAAWRLSHPLPAPVIVPNLLRNSLEQSRRVLADQGLHLGRVNSEPSRSEPPGLVLRQHPAAGVRLSPGASVDIWIAERVRLSPQPPEPPQHVTVPNVLRGNLEQSRRLLADQGLEVGRVISEPSTAAGPGLVIRQDPPAGTRVPRGTSVDIWVGERTRDRSQELQPVRVPVPTVIGMSPERAAATLSQSRLRLGGQNIVRRLDGPPYRVIGQRPAPGAQAPRGSAVDIDLEGTLR
jgi:beta-lactam-binding protein with PASTA domain